MSRKGRQKNRERHAERHGVRERILGAGGVVFNPDGQVLLIRYADGAWTFPKGHIDPGETIPVAAVREVHEEGGVEARIILELGFTEYVNPKGVARRVHWYAMRTDATTALAEPGFQAGFFPLETALKRLGHLQNKQLLRDAANRLGVAFSEAPRPSSPVRGSP